MWWWGGAAAAVVAESFCPRPSLGFGGCIALPLRALCLALLSAPAFRSLPLRPLPTLPCCRARYFCRAWERSPPLPGRPRLTRLYLVFAMLLEFSNEILYIRQ